MTGTSIRDNTDESQNNPEYEKPEKKGYVLCDFICMLEEERAADSNGRHPQGKWPHRLSRNPKYQLLET